MRTSRSEIVARQFYAVLEKAYQEELHPRDETGKWAKKPAVTSAKPSKPIPILPVRFPLHRATPDEWNRQKYIVQNTFSSDLQQRMGKLTDPQEIKNFADALMDEGFPNYILVAKDGFARLREMGWDEQGNVLHQAQEEISQQDWEQVIAAMTPAQRQRMMAWTQTSIKANIESLTETASDPSRVLTAKKLVHPREREGARYSGETYRIEMADGSKAVWKPTGGTGLLNAVKDAGGGNVLRTSLDARILESDRELAAYQMSEAMGMGIVPPVVKASLPIGSGGEGHMMAWVAGKDQASWTQDYEDALLNNHIDLQRISALDYLTGNTDRHTGNLLKGEDGHYYAIDNGLMFPRDMVLSEFRSEILDELPEEAISNQVKEEVRRLTPEKIRAIMGGVFREDDIRGVIARRETFLNRAVWGEWQGWWADSKARARSTRGRP